MASRILLADDSITIQKVVNLTFADEGIDVVTVSNGEMAQRRLAEINPDLVLADIFMPGKNGYELCQYIKESPQFRTVPVVLLVGAFEPFDQAEARRVSADGHLTKPFESRVLVETVRKLIQERKSASGQLKYAQQAQAAGSVPETRPLNTQPLEAPFNIDLSPIEESGLSSGIAWGSTDSMSQQEPDSGLSHLSSFGEPFRLDYGAEWHPEPAAAEPNGGNGQWASAAKSERVTADLTPVPGEPDTLGFDFTEVDQPESPLAADAFSADLFTTGQSVQPPPSLPDFTTPFKAEDELLNMELSQVKTGPLEAPGTQSDAAVMVDWNQGAAGVTPVHDVAPPAPVVTAPAVGQTPQPHAFLGEEEPLGDILSDEPGEGVANIVAQPSETHAYESSIWSVPAPPAAPVDDNITIDFNSPEHDHFVDSTDVSGQSNQVPLSSLGPGDFLIGSDEVKGTGAASLDFADLISSTPDEDAVSLPFQPLSLEPETAGKEPPAVENAAANDPVQNFHEDSRFANLSDFRASEMWAPEEAQFSPIDIEAIPVPEEPSEPDLLVQQAGEPSQVSQPIELTSTEPVSEPIELIPMAQAPEPIELDSTGHVPEAQEPIDLTSTAHVTEPLELTSTPPVWEPSDLASTPARPAETSLGFAVPAHEEVIPEIGFDIVQPAAEPVVAQPDIASPAEASSFAAGLPAEPAREQEQKVAGDGSVANLSASAVEGIVRRVLQEMSDSVVREIAWEVVPDCVERVVAATVERLARESLAKRG